MDRPFGLLVRMKRLLFTGIVLLLATAGAADAATRHVIRGAGFGHGIGMSQYGAYGFAQHGRDYKQILAHYYRRTELRTASTRKVRVLLQASDPYVRFRGASRLAGVRDLNRRVTYRVEPSRGLLGLFRGEKLVGRYRKLRVYRPGGVIRLLGPAINGISSGRYRGTIDIRPGTEGGATAVNRLNLDHYVRGVVAGEMPSTWHMQALRVQAVAARTYALATKRTGGTFDLYPDTRSQVYRGVAGETSRTDRAVRSTENEVVTYDGDPAVTYYSSTSGGHTENVENSFLGSDPKPWLKGVEDPYDDISPRHRWRMRFSTRAMDSRLGKYSPGSFRKIRVLRRGVSPRIVRARVYGTDGTRIITGPTLRSRLDLNDTWAYFTRVTTSASRAGRLRLASRRGLTRAFDEAHVVRGVFDPLPAGRVLKLERRVKGRWLRVRALTAGAGGAYSTRVRRPGVYRVRAGSITGPSVRVT